MEKHCACPYIIAGAIILFTGIISFVAVFPSTSYKHISIITVLLLAADVALGFGMSWKRLLWFPVTVVLMATGFYAFKKIRQFLRNRNDLKLRKEAERVMQSVAPPHHHYR